MLGKAARQKSCASIEENTMAGAGSNWIWLLTRK
jgi:hypothetical protein